MRYPAVLNNIVGTKFKVIMGYRSTNQVDLAMERGEVQGRAGTFNTIKAVYGEWLKDKKINILVQIGPEKEPGYESVPLLTEFAKDYESRAVLQSSATISRSAVRSWWRRGCGRPGGAPGPRSWGP